MAVLPGCVSPKGIAPTSAMVDTPQLATGRVIAQADVIPWPNEHWWDAYQDAQLSQLVVKGLRGNPDLKKAIARMRLSTAIAEQMHAATLPSIGGKASTSRERFTELSFIPPPWAGRFNWNNQATLAMSYDLDIWRQKKSLWLASLEESKVTEAEMQQVRIELATTIVRTYIRLAAQYQLKALANVALDDLLHEIAITKRAYAAGLATQLNLSTLEARLPAVRNKVEQQALHIAILNNQIAALCGEGPGAGEHIDQPRMSLVFSIGLPETLPANLVGRRPDIQAAKWRVQASDYYVKSAKADFYPNINLLSFAGFQALAFTQLFSTAGLVAGVGPAISLPLFDGGKRRATLSAQTALYDMAVEEYNGTVLHALESISSELSVLGSNAHEIRNTQQAVQQAEQAHQLALRHYKAGLSNYLESLQTHALVLQQTEVLVALEEKRLDGYASLMLQLGGGLGEMPTTVSVQGKP